MSSVGFLKPFQPAQATYNMTASEEELMQETLVLENAQRPELHIWAHPERGIHELLEPAHVCSCAKHHWLSASSREAGPRAKAQRLNVLGSLDLSDVAEPAALSQWNTESEPTASQGSLKPEKSSAYLSSVFEKRACLSIQH